jgi:hypothetical protein
MSSCVSDVSNHATAAAEPGNKCEVVFTPLHDEAELAVGAVQREVEVREQLIETGDA